jgi:4-diphosphocytidyl-2-C-methyl-D-erythritol kinase
VWIEEAGAFMQFHRPLSGMPAPAKLNLSLAVLGKRADGYHEIESLMVGTTLHDTIAVGLAATVGDRDGDELPVALRVRFAGRLATEAGAALRRDVPTDGSNLVVRAVRALAMAAGESRGLEIELEKRIPSGAGLGGGSSDAATAIRAAANAWGIDWPDERLAAIGEALGSDVPWFFAGGPAVAGGRGERIDPVDGIPALAAVIACPSAGLSTPLVYRHCTPDPSRRGEAARLAALLADGRLRAAGTLMHNDLEAPARRLLGDLDRLLDSMRRGGAVRPMLTGSGSACFAVTETATLARRIASRLELEGWPGVFVVRLVPGRRGAVSGGRSPVGRQLVG